MQYGYDWFRVLMVIAVVLGAFALNAAEVSAQDEHLLTDRSIRLVYYGDMPMAMSFGNGLVYDPVNQTLHNMYMSDSETQVGRLLGIADGVMIARDYETNVVRGLDANGIELWKMDFSESEASPVTYIRLSEQGLLVQRQDWSFEVYDFVDTHIVWRGSAISSADYILFDELDKPRVMVDRPGPHSFVFNEDGLLVMNSFGLWSVTQQETINIFGEAVSWGSYPYLGGDVLTVYTADGTIYIDREGNVLVDHKPTEGDMLNNFQKQVAEGVLTFTFDADANMSTFEIVDVDGNQIAGPISLEGQASSYIRDGVLTVYDGPERTYANFYDANKLEVLATGHQISENSVEVCSSGVCFELESQTPLEPGDLALEYVSELDAMQASFSDGDSIWLLHANGSLTQFPRPQIEGYFTYSFYGEGLLFLQAVEENPGQKARTFGTIWAYDARTGELVWESPAE